MCRLLSGNLRLAWLLPALFSFLLCQRAHAADDYVAPDYLEGPGVMFRTAFSGGQGVPQIQSIIPVELFPYYFAEESLFFSDLRFFPTTNLTVGGNAGLGYRYYSEGLDRVFGASGWYDGDNTRSVLFQQAGLSLETLSQNLDFRTNLYLPVGPTSRQTALWLVNNSTAFSGNNLVYSQYRAWYTALKGFDMEVGVPIPGEIPEGMGMRLYGGGYHFQDNSGNSINGASARMQANLIAGLDAQIQVTYDNFFQTRLFGGISWTFGALHRSEMKQTTAYGRMGEHVNRNYTVVAQGHGELENITAINPATGQPYTFAHVANDPPPVGPLGSVGNPFTTIAAGQATGADIVYVHAGSVFNNGPTIALLPNQRVLGDGPGIQYFVPVPQLGMLALPHAGSGAFPTLNGSLGDAVVLASNSQLAGFSITNAAGRGIFGNGVQNVTLSNVSVGHSNLDGIVLQNIPGTVSLAGINVSNSGGAGINIMNNTGLVQFAGNNTVANSGGAGIIVNGGTGQIQFAGLTTVSNASGDAVSIL
ncbi:MAG TPA: inverse autotransporter beta domain-containing protein, partial [Planctomycetaceae bacterium]